MLILRVWERDTIHIGCLSSHLPWPLLTRPYPTACSAHSRLSDAVMVVMLSLTWSRLPSISKSNQYHFHKSIKVIDKSKFSSHYSFLNYTIWIREQFVLNYIIWNRTTASKKKKHRLKNKIEEMRTNIIFSGWRWLKCAEIDQLHFKNSTMCGGLDSGCFRRG